MYLCTSFHYITKFSFGLCLYVWGEVGYTGGMKIALVHDFLVRYGGAERVLKVMSEMYPDAPIYTLMYDQASMASHFSPDRIRTSSMQKWAKWPGRVYRFFFAKMPRAIEEFDFSGFDVVLSSSQSYAHGILTPQRTKHISYCHSPTRYLWDYTHQYMEDHGYKGVTKLFILKLMNYVRRWDFLASDRPDLYIANSHNVARRIQKYYKRESEVIYPPVDVERFEVSRESEDYFLIVSQLSPYKRVDLAVQLFNKLGKRLMIIGAGPQESYLRGIAGPSVEILGSKSDEEVAMYMKYCRALIFPGEDDFGIVPIEAMACGKPVLAYGEGGAVETVLPGVTGELFASPTVDSMEAGLTKMLLNMPLYRTSRIREHAEKFSRKVFERKLREVVRG